MAIITYMVSEGDTLWDIAQRFNTTVNAILMLNPDIENPDLIYPGQLIKIRI